MVACRMTDFEQHIPVLLHEAVDSIVQNPQGIYIDATFGRGSHSKAILNRLHADGRLIAFDKDPEAIQFAKNHFQDQRFQIIHASFAEMTLRLQKINVPFAIDGILFDLGVSSPQLNNPHRGFSFLHDGKLDMRMDPNSDLSAADWLQTVDESELAHVIWMYGEEKYSRRIARAIVAARDETRIDTTTKLANLIMKVVPKQKHYDKHPATRTFQAIRIAINHELTDLQAALVQALDLLKINGRLAVISFHSLEDRIVKQFIKLHEKGEELPRGLPIKGKTFHSRLKSIGKPIKPSENEVNINPRARSAILRIAEKRL